MSSDIQFTKSIFASVAHRYWNEQWSCEKNVQIYGADALEEGIGSNLRIEIGWQGDLETTEMILSPALERIKALVDHKCLFSPPLGAEPSTLENITCELTRELLRVPPLRGRWRSLTVWESEHLGCISLVNEAAIYLVFKLFNLTLDCQIVVNPETGLGLSRWPLRDRVREVFFTQDVKNQDLDLWSRQLFAALAKSIQSLKRLRIDLGRHEYLLVHSDTIMIRPSKNEA